MNRNQHERHQSKLGVYREQAIDDSRWRGTLPRSPAIAQKPLVASRINAGSYGRICGIDIPPLIREPRTRRAS